MRFCECGMLLVLSGVSNLLECSGCKRSSLPTVEALESVNVEKSTLPDLGGGDEDSDDDESMSLEVVQHGDMGAMEEASLPPHELLREALNPLHALHPHVVCACSGVCACVPVSEAVGAKHMLVCVQCGAVN